MTQDPTRQAGPVRPPRAARRSRLGLFLPYILLLIAAAAWSVGWVWIRARTASEIDAWVAREATAGRSWTCVDRTITGYPFRIELRCSALGLERADGHFRLGPLAAVAQVYQPRLVQFESAGPFHAEQGDLTGDAAWGSLRGSFHGTEAGFARASLAVDSLKVTVAGVGPEPVAVSAGHLELHGRPTPGRFDSEGAVDVSLRLAGAVAPRLDALTGDDAPADLSLDATVTRATLLGTGQVARELERWRNAGGALDLTTLSLSKGDQRVQARGALTLDDAHRPAGQVELRAAGIDALVGGLIGQRFGSDRGALVGQLVGGLLGLAQRPPPDGQGNGRPAQAPLKPLPPLRLVDGRLLFGGFPIPNVRVPALY